MTILLGILSYYVLGLVIAALIMKYTKDGTITSEEEFYFIWGFWGIIIICMPLLIPICVIYLFIDYTPQDIGGDGFYVWFRKRLKNKKVKENREESIQPKQQVRLKDIL